MSAIKNIREYIDPRPDDDLITTRELLDKGKTRGAVDNATHLLVKSGELVRQAYGVFCKSTCKKTFTVAEIAQAKALAFYREIIEDAETVAAKLKMITVEHNEVAFAVSGNTSSFKCLVSNVRVYFKRVSRRKIRMGDHPVGQKLRAFWHAGEEYTDKFFKEVFPRITGPDLRLAYQFRACVPHWLNDEIGTLW